MARTVADAALLLTALAAPDSADPAAPAADGPEAVDYSRFLNADALKGKRFGLMRQAMGYHPDVDALTEKAVAAVKAAGAEVRDVRIPSYDAWNEPELEVLLYEFKDGLNRYLRASGAPQTSLEALIAWNKAHAATVMPHFGQELFERAQQKGPLTDAAYLKARDTARRLAGADGLLAVLEREKLDALIAPTVSPAWPTDYVLGDHFVGAGYGIAAVAGTPSLTIPIGDSRGLPIGLTFMGRSYSEGDLIGYGHALEQILRARRPPAFTPVLDLRADSTRPQ
jgi:amidase